MNIIDLNKINKSYGTHQVLKDVSLEIPSETIFGLLGPNGAGKTSLLRILTQIIAPDSGIFLFKGKKPDPTHIQQIGYLPEERGLYKKMTVADQLMYFARLKGINKNTAAKRIDSWIEKFDLGPWMKKHVEELSKGMQQKVQFIAAIIHEPELIILDEPFSGFDPINSDIITKAILELKKSGSTIIFSTHRMETVEALCESIALINKGEKILDGNILKLKEKYKKNIFQVEGIGELKSNDCFTVLSKEKKKDDQFIANIELINMTTTNFLIGEIMRQVQIISFKEQLPAIHDIFISQIKEVSHG